MALKVGELFATADIRDKQFNRKMSNMKGMIGKGGKLALAAGAGAAAIGAALAGASAKGIKEFAKFEKQMSEVFTLMPDATNEAKNQMTADMREFSKEMGVMTDEAAPALYQAISAGVPRDNVFSFLEQAQKAAVGGVTDLKTAVDGMTSVVNAYGEERSEEHTSELQSLR